MLLFSTANPIMNVSLQNKCVEKEKKTNKIRYYLQEPNVIIFATYFVFKFCPLKKPSGRKVCNSLKISGVIGIPRPE
jgi:hypothetical protein